MNELITITKQNINNEEVNSVSARDLHNFLGNTERFSTWYDRQVRYGFMEGLDYIGCKTFNTLANQDLQDYIISIDMAKEIAMIQRTDKGKQARLYFIACEKQLQQQLQRSLPATYKAALIELVQQIEINEQQQLVIEHQENTIDNLSTALDTLVEWVSILKIAKHNKVSEKQFNWRKLKAQSESMGFIIKKAESPRYGYQNLYHIAVFKACYPQYNYALLTE